MDSSPESAAAATPPTFSYMPDDALTIMLRTLDASSLVSFARTTLTPKPAVLNELLVRLDSRTHEESLVSCLVLLLNNDPFACDRLNLLQEFRDVNEAPTARSKLVIKLVLLAMKRELSLVVKLLQQKELSGYIINLLLTDHRSNQQQSSNDYQGADTGQNKSLFLSTLEILAESESDIELFVRILFKLAKTVEGLSFLDRYRSLWVKVKILNYSLNESNQHILAWLASQDNSACHDLVVSILTGSVLPGDMKNWLLNKPINCPGDETSTSLLFYLAGALSGQHWILVSATFEFELIEPIAFHRVAYDKRGDVIGSPASALFKCPFFVSCGKDLVRLLSANDHGVMGLLSQLLANSDSDEVLLRNHIMLTTSSFNLADMIFPWMENKNKNKEEKERLETVINLARTEEGAQVLDHLNEKRDGRWLPEEMLKQADGNRLAQVLTTTCTGISILKKLVGELNFNELGWHQKLLFIRQLVCFPNGIRLLYEPTFRALVDIDILNSKYHHEHPHATTVVEELAREMVGLFWLLSFFAGTELLDEEHYIFVVRIINKLSLFKKQNSNKYSEPLPQKKYFERGHAEAIIWYADWYHSLHIRGPKDDRYHEFHSYGKENLINDIDLFISSSCDPADHKRLYLYASKQPLVSARLFWTSRTTKYFWRKASACSDTPVEASCLAPAAIGHP